MAKQCWSQTVLESGSWGHSVLQTPALVIFFLLYFSEKIRLKISYELSAPEILSQIFSEK